MTTRARDLRQVAGVAAVLGALLALAGWVLFSRTLSRVDGDVGVGVGAWLAVAVTGTVVGVVSVAVASVCSVLAPPERS